MMIIDVFLENDTPVHKRIYLDQKLIIFNSTILN